MGPSAQRSVMPGPKRQVGSGPGWARAWEVMASERGERKAVSHIWHDPEVKWGKEKDVQWTWHVSLVSSGGRTQKQSMEDEDRGSVYGYRSQGVLVWKTEHRKQTGWQQSSVHHHPSYRCPGPDCPLHPSRPCHWSDLEANPGHIIASVNISVCVSPGEGL